MSTFERIFEAVSAMPVIDTHEHLPPFERERERPADILREYLSHYYSRDVISAGFPIGNYEQLRDASRPVEERWDMAAPFIERSRNTAYFRSLDITTRALYDMPFAGEHIRALNERVEAEAEGAFKRVLKERCGIEKSVLDAFFTVPTEDAFDRELFAGAFRLDQLIGVWDDARHALEKASGLLVHSLMDYLGLIEWTIKRVKACGFSAFKLGMAYGRPLYFSAPTFAEAERVFNAQCVKGASNPYDISSPTERRVLEDFLMRRCLDAVEETGLPLQVHTGLLESSGNTLSNSDPELLTNLLLEYPGVNFDLFHIGYPYWQSLSAMAKMFPNAYIDMCWAHIISPSACRAAMRDFLDAVPRSKVSAFGGDYLFVDAVYGHLSLARRNVAMALASACEDGDMGVEDAIATARMWLYENPKRLFAL